MPCRRCRSRGEECAYEDKKWRTKDHLRSEIERLRTEQRQGHALLRALTNNDAERCEVALDRLRAGEPPDAIAEWIRSSSCPSGPPSQAPQTLSEPPYPGGLPQHVLSSIRKATSLGGEPVHSADFQGPGLGNARRPAHRPAATGAFGAPRTVSAPSQGSFGSTSRGSFSTDVPPMHRLSSRCPPPSQPPLPLLLAPPALPVRPPGVQGRPILQHADFFGGHVLRIWTKVTSDARLVERLIAGFFANSLAHLSLISRAHFLRDFRDGNPRYCSEALVNAVLGMASRLSDPASQLISKLSFGDAFIGEAKKLLAAEEEHTSLPSIQALAVLALAEMSQGNEDEAGDLARESVRACIRFVLQTQHQGGGQDDGFREVRALAYCGGFSLIR